MTRRRRRGAPPSPRLRVVRTASGRECPPSICSSRRSGNQAVSTRQERGEEPREEGRGEEPREGRGEEPKAASLSLPSHRASLSLPSHQGAAMNTATCRNRLRVDPHGGGAADPLGPPMEDFPKAVSLSLSSRQAPTGSRGGEKSQAEKGRRARRRRGEEPLGGLPLPLRHQASLSPSLPRPPSPPPPAANRAPMH